ncbi:MAG: hypothetical protein ACREGB_04700 [Candidatus Saccharimonadales bacterium]
MSLENKIKELIAEEGLEYKERGRTIYTTCPKCNQNDKFSILKANGHCICYRGTCQFFAWFHDWLALTAGISRDDAIARLYGQPTVDHTIEKIDLHLTDTPKAVPDGEPIKPIRWPLPHAMSINSPFAGEGANYLIARGIPVDVAHKYGIMYSP